MGDMGDDFRAWNKYIKEKKLSNLESSTEILIRNQINFTSHNGGVHLIITSLNEIIDYWPSTGKWIVRKSNKQGRGVFKLLKRINKTKLTEEFYI